MEFLADILHNEMPCSRYVSTMEGKLGYIPDSFQGALNATFHWTCTVPTVSWSFLQISFTMKCHVPDTCPPWKERWATSLDLYCTNCLMEFLADFLHNEMQCTRYVSTLEGKLGYLIHFREYKMPYYTALVLYQLSHGVSSRFPLQ